MKIFWRLAKNKHLKDYSYNKILILSNAKDLEELRDKEADKYVWQNMVEKNRRIYAEVDDSYASSTEAND